MSLIKSVTLLSVLLTTKKSSGAELMALEFGYLGFAASIVNLSVLVPFLVIFPFLPSYLIVS